MGQKNIYFDQETAKELDELKKKMKAGSAAEVVRRSLNLTHRMMDGLEKGTEVLLRGPTGSLTKILII